MPARDVLADISRSKRPRNASLKHLDQAAAEAQGKFRRLRRTRAQQQQAMTHGLHHDDSSFSGGSDAENVSPVADRTTAPRSQHPATRIAAARPPAASQAELRASDFGSLASHGAQPAVHGSQVPDGTCNTTVGTNVPASAGLPRRSSFSAALDDGPTGTSNPSTHCFSGPQIPLQREQQHLGKFLPPVTSPSSISAATLRSPAGKRCKYGDRSPPCR